jgi:hypothetical protein
MFNHSGQTGRGSSQHLRIFSMPEYSSLVRVAVAAQGKEEPQELLDRVAAEVREEVLSSMKFHCLSYRIELM